MNLLLALILLPAQLFAANVEPKAVVEDIFAKASAPSIAKDLEKQAEVNAHVDFDALATAALGSQKKKIPAKEYLWFRTTLQEIITRTVYPEAPDFLAGVKIQYDSVEVKNGHTLVKSTVQQKADLTEVSYKLAPSEDSWKVVDVSISGVSWVDSIRDQVRDTVKKKQWKGLKDAMNKRVKELRDGKVS